MNAVRVNGREHPLESGETVQRLLERLGLSGRFALVELNGEPVERSRYSEVALASGDTVIVALPVAGG